MQNHAFNLENIKSVINAIVVPYGSDGLDLDIDDSEITIKKPYIDDDGDARGNSVFIDSNNNGMAIFMTIELQDDVEIAVIVYRATDKNKFSMLDETAPQAIQDYATDMWPKIINTLYAAGANWQADFATSQQVFEAQFAGKAVPDIVQKLFVLQKIQGTEVFSECFYLADYDKGAMQSWSEDPAFTNAFVEFACANGSGSFYAFWAIQNDLNACPIVVFGDEGGVHVIAQNVNELLHLLTFDSEISVSHEDAYFYREDDDPDYEPSEQRDIYWNFVKKQLNLDPITSMEQCDDIVAVAQQKHQANLDAFLANYIDD